MLTLGFYLATADDLQLLVGPTTKGREDLAQHNAELHNHLKCSSHAPLVVCL
jgi:hypothetical protein